MTGAGRRNATLPTRYVRDAASPDSSGALQLRPGGKRVAPGLALRALPGTRSRWSLARRLGSALHAAVGYGRASPPDAFGRFRSRLRRLWYIGGRFALWTSIRFLIRTFSFATAGGNATAGENPQKNLPDPLASRAGSCLFRRRRGSARYTVLLLKAEGPS